MSSMIAPVIKITIYVYGKELGDRKESFTKEGVVKLSKIAHWAVFDEKNGLIWQTGGCSELRQSEQGNTHTEYGFKHKLIDLELTGTRKDIESDTKIWNLYDKINNSPNNPCGTYVAWLMFKQNQEFHNYVSQKNNQALYDNLTNKKDIDSGFSKAIMKSLYGLLYLWLNSKGLLK